LFEEPLAIGDADATRGLGALGEVTRVGGAARLSTALGAARLGQTRTLYLDSADFFEGGATFPIFQGEPELRVASALGLDAATVGNHDFALGSAGLAAAHRAFASFPLLAANYEADAGSPLSRELAPWAILNADGLSVGVIGVGYPIDSAGRVDGTDASGVTGVATADAVQAAIDWLSPSADLIVALTHQGLDADQALIANTSGLDVVLGGHQHIVTNGALSLLDCGSRLKTGRGCTPRPVTLMHSGAFARYLGVLDLALDDGPQVLSANLGFEVASAKQTVVPLSAAVEQDAAVVSLLEPYRGRLEALGYGDAIAFALGDVTRVPATGGESALGNLTCDAILATSRADFAIINGSGLRGDLASGVWTREDVVRALPFTDPITVIWLTGSEFLALLEEQAAGASDCQAPLQIAGFELTIDCAGAVCSGPACSPHGTLQVTKLGRPIDPDGVYSLATTAYLANGGNGFELLSGTAAGEVFEDTPETALIDRVAAFAACAASSLPCVDPATLLDGRLVMRGG
jgi:5'-nucleotidase